jgi:antitoxin component YwqK of YwqJK toxin-antitoxin module
MYRLVGAILDFFLVNAVNAQETKFVTRRNSDPEKMKDPKNQFIEEYYVLKNDEDIRHGTYVKYRPAPREIQLLESGRYQNGQKDGLWEYYHAPIRDYTNSIKEKGNYVNGKRNGVWTSYYRDTIPEAISHERFGNKRKADSISVSIVQRAVKLKIAGMYLNDKRVGEWTSFNYLGSPSQRYNFSKQQLIFDAAIKDTAAYNTNRGALYIGGRSCLVDFLTGEFALTPSLIFKVKGDSAGVVVSFTINEDGNVIDPHVENSNSNKHVENEAMRIIALTKSNWIPAVLNSKRVASIYKIRFSIVRKSISATSQKIYPICTPLIE